MAELSPAAGDWRDNFTWYTHETPFMRLIHFLGKPFFYSLGRVDCTGLEHVPAAGPCIIAANHISNFDVVYIGASVPRFPQFMAKVELYQNPFFGWLIRQLGSFPVYRGESDTWALAQAGRILDAGQMLVMFPEGTRSKQKARLKQGKVGVVKLALEHRAPVVPAAIWGTENFRFRLRHRQKITIRIGEPLDVVSMAGPPPYSRNTLRELTTVVMQRIANMLPPEYRGVYA